MREAAGPSREQKRGGGRGDKATQQREKTKTSEARSQSSLAGDFRQGCADKQHRV